MRKAAAVLGLLVAFSVHGSSADLVADIYRGDATESSRPEGFFSNGRLIYFFADDGSGSELWTTDGTTGGTRMVAELTPGVGPQYPDDDVGGFTASGDLVWFWYTSPYAGDDFELWRTDGTRNGTFAVARHLGYRSLALAPIGTRGVVASTTDAFLSSDGTVEGTHSIELEADFILGSREPADLIAFRGLVYFIHAQALWRTDGTTAGTTRVGGLPDDFDDISAIVAGQDAIYIVGDSDDDWETHYVVSSDGTQPVVVATFPETGSDPPRLIDNGGVVYAFVGVDEKLTEIWRLGKVPQRVTVIEGDTETDTFLDASGGYLYFETDHPDVLWRSDGTAAGTRIFEGVDVSEELFVAGSRVFVLSGRGLQVSDGAGTTNLTSHAVHSWNPPAAALGDLIVLSIRDEKHGEELWASDGTPQGTRLLKNIRADGHSYASDLHSLGDELLFSAVTEEDGEEPWISDGTPWGTRLLADLIRGPSGGDPQAITALANGRAVFVAARKLYATDGNLTEMLRNTNDDIYAADDGTALPVIDGRAWVVFSGDDRDELWSTDGTKTGTKKLMDLSYRMRDFPTPSANGLLFFVAGDGLYRTDGTEAGTFAVASFPEQLHAVAGRLFFLSRTAAHGRELWVTDGTLGGTHIVRDIHRGPADAFQSDYPYSELRVVMQSAGDVLFFAADDGVHGVEPWRSDGTEAGTFLLRDIAPGEASSMLPMFEREVTAFADGFVFFGADDGVHGYELWRSNLESAELLRDIAPGHPSSNPTRLRPVGDLVYFSADDGRHGRELWSASPARASFVADVNPGSDSSHPREMTELHGRIYFFATTQETGDELWSVEPTQVRRRSVR